MSISITITFDVITRRGALIRSGSSRKTTKQRAVVDIDEPAILSHMAEGASKKVTNALDISGVF